MSYVPNQKTTTAPPVVEINETTGGGPLAAQRPGAAYSYKRRRVGARTRIERIGYWVVVAAAFVALLLLLKLFLPPLVGALITGGVVAAFAGLLTLMNLARASNWGNMVLGRKVFPAIRATDAEIWHLARINTGLMFAFTFVFGVLAYFLGAFFGGLLVFGGLIAAAIFYNRVRTVVIKP